MLNLTLVKKFPLVILLIFSSFLLYPIGYFLYNKQEESSEYKTKAAIKGEGIGSYIINLDRSKERLNYVYPFVKSLDFPITRISAIDGYNLSQAEIDQYLDKKIYSIVRTEAIKVGTIGCSLSHIKVWQEFLNSDYEFAMIFEDDVSFDPIILKDVVSQLTENKELWDLVSFAINHKGSPLTILKLRGGQKLSLYLMHISNSGTYLINRRAAFKLLEKALPIRIPVDQYFNRIWELDIKFLGIENPRIVYQTFGDSDIESSKEAMSQNSRTLLTKFLHTSFNIQTAIMKFFANLKLYIQLKLSLISQ